MGLMVFPETCSQTAAAEPHTSSPAVFYTRSLAGSNLPRSDQAPQRAAREQRLLRKSDSRMAVTEPPNPDPITTTS